MFRSLDLLGLSRGRATLQHPGGDAHAGAKRQESAPVHMWRYLPLATIATGSVVALPGAVVAAIVPWNGALSAVLCASLAMAGSIALASLEAAAWTRQRRSRDLLFSDLMLWGWVRRCWAERRLARARELYEAARKAGPAVSINLLQGLSKRLEARDAYTHGHSRRVARHAGSIARTMRLSPTEVAKIRTAATVHDVGKLHTPREILNNPGRLSDEEFAIVKLHPGDGADMLSGVGDPEIAAMVRHHHERIDGHGYPDGLTGSQIPLGARIIAVADTFDAITSARAYRRASNHKKALDILSREAGSQLDGAAVAAFLRGYSPRRSLALLAFATAIPERIFAGLQATSSSVGLGAGTTSILPLVGAAGLFAFAPGLHSDTPAGRGAHRKPTIASHRAATEAPRTTTATRQIRRVASSHPPSHTHHENRRRPPASPPTTTSPQHTTSSKPATPAARTDSPEPTTSPPPKTEPSTPAPETTTTETPPPVVEVPTLPELPVKLPVKVPTIPGVPLPGVK